MFTQAIASVFSSHGLLAPHIERTLPSEQQGIKSPRVNFKNESAYLDLSLEAKLLLGSISKKPEVVTSVSFDSKQDRTTFGKNSAANKAPPGNIAQGYKEEKLTNGIGNSLNILA